MSETPTPAALYALMGDQLTGAAWAYQTRCPKCRGLISGARFFRGRKVWVLGATGRRSPEGVFTKIPFRAYTKKPVGEPVGCRKHRDTWEDYA